MVEQFEFKTFNLILQLCLVLSIASGSTDIGSIFKSEDVNIKDICKLGTVGFNNPEVRTILDTYELCLTKIDSFSGKDRERLLHALLSRLECLKEDLKQAYYSGNIEYKDIQLVKDFTKQMRSNRDKLIERTKGFNPRSIRCQSVRKTRSTVKHIIPLVITGTLSEKQRACEAILKQDKYINTTNLEIPTPKLDDNKDPKELTVPWKKPSTYKVDSPEAAKALTRYYKVVMKCLTLTTKHQIQVFRFNKKLYQWLEADVLPHLTDDKCYPAFGGVLRIVQTMRENDYVPKNATAKIIFYRQRNLEDRAKQIKQEESVRRGNILPPYVIYLIVWPLVFILFVMLCCQCFLCRSRAGGDPYSESAGSEKFYYVIEGTPSISIDFESFDSDSSGRRLGDLGLAGKGCRPEENRQRGGGDDPSSLNLVCEEESRLMGVQLKRQYSSKDSSCLKSPGKRQRKMWGD